MRLTIDAFVSLLIIAIGILTFGQLINEHSTINEARNYHTEIVDRLESSHFNDSVVKDVQDEIKQLNQNDDRGYTLTVTDVTNDTDDSNSLTLYDDYKIVKITLNYKVSIPLFGTIDEGVISGYAR